MSASLLRRIAKLEAGRDDDFLAFDDERLLPDGSIELRSKRRELWGLPSLVGTVPAGEVEQFRRRLIRIKEARHHAQD